MRANRGPAAGEERTRSTNSKRIGLSQEAKSASASLDSVYDDRFTHTVSHSFHLRPINKLIFKIPSSI